VSSKETDYLVVEVVDVHSFPSDALCSFKLNE
jgi:hypothetical protein